MNTNACIGYTYVIAAPTNRQFYHFCLSTALYSEVYKYMGIHSLITNGTQNLAHGNWFIKAFWGFCNPCLKLAVSVVFPEEVFKSPGFDF